MSDFPDAKGAATDPKAGLSARKMTNSHLAIGSFFLLLSTGGIYRYMGSNQAIVSLCLTVTAIVGVKIYHWAEAKSDKVEKFADRAIAWKRGAAAEEGVGGLLEALPDNYFVMNDFATKKGSIDYILAGPKGVLTIETKSDKGVVTRNGEKLSLDGLPFEEDVIKQAWAKSYLVRDLLAEKGVCTLRPQPVIVFTDADVQVKERVGRVQIIGMKDLHAFLEGLPVWMSERLSKGIIDCLWATQNH
ncbi:MAG: NERD domain-containing protein [Deltaproteobacteria bacterium]|nr:NERD domain-containing protein [Deltaproteobacteria bacterium]